MKEKRREEKRKLKALKKADEEDEEQIVDVDNDVNEGMQGESSGDESSEGPDLSWLPDPDKIYGKQQDSDEEASAGESENDEKSEGESEGSEEESIARR